jgi:hypothetical protein
MTSPAPQEILFVPAQFATLQQAVDAVREPATIVVEPGVHAGSVRVDGKTSLVIQSARLARRGVTMTGGLSIVDSHVWLSGVEIRGAARAIAVDGGSLSLQECVIAGSRTREPFGAAMLCRNAAVRVQKSAIVGNVIEADDVAGGAALYFCDCRIEIAGSTIQGNAAYGREARGGGIWCERSSMRMWRSRVTDNALFGEVCEGSGIYFREPLDCRLGGSVITGNGSVAGRGGGVFIAGDARRVVIHRDTVVRQNHPNDVEISRRNKSSS